MSKQNCGCYLLLVSVAMAWACTEGLYLWADNRQPMEIPCADFKPRLAEQASWFRLTNCEIDLTKALYFENHDLKKILQVFVPIRTSSAPDAPVYLLVSIRDRKTSNLVEGLVGLRGEELEHYIQEKAPRFRPDLADRREQRRRTSQEDCSSSNLTAYPA